jgi:hypothetical protein
MKHFIAILAILGVCTAAIFASQAAHAQGALSDDEIEHIRQNCVNAQTTLGRIHASDALLRVNRGQLYELISTKLMAPLNSRIALGRFEGLKLAATTIEYDREREVFTTSYKEYDDAISHTLKIDCKEKPIEFYQSLQTAREKRQKVHQDTEALTALLEAYRAEFESFANDFKETAQ